MKKMLLGLVLATGLAMTGCAATVQAQEGVVAEGNVGAEVFPTGISQYGCIVIVDQWGEREVCSNYYVVNGGYVYYDWYFHSWISPYGYWYGGYYHHGYWAGYHDHYGSYYHERGWHEQHGWARNGNGYHPQSFNHAQHVQSQHYSAPQHSAPQQHTAPQQHSGAPHAGNGGHAGGGGHGGGGHGGGHR